MPDKQPDDEPVEKSSSEDQAVEDQLEERNPLKRRPRRDEEAEAAMRKQFDAIAREQSRLLREITKPIMPRWVTAQTNMISTITNNITKKLTINAPQVKVLDDLKAQLAGPGSAMGKLVERQQSVLYNSIPRYTASFVLPEIKMPWLEGLRTDFQALLPKFDFPSLRRTMLRLCPPNWHDLPEGASLATLFDLGDTGTPIAWVPRAEVLTELTGADDQAGREAVLSAHQAEIIVDCSSCLDEVTAAELSEQALLLREAISAAEDDRFAPAQALAASVLDTTLRHSFDPKRLAEFYKTVEKARRNSVRGYYARVLDQVRERDRETDANAMRELRWGLVYTPLVVVLKEFWPGDRVPTTFNRHACAHAASLIQFTPVNCLLAIALATSLLREAQQKLIDDAAEEAAA